VHRCGVLGPLTWGGARQGAPPITKQAWRLDGLARLYEDFGPAVCREVLAAYTESLRDAAPTFDDVRAWYLLEAPSWTLEKLSLGRREDLAHGLREIRREVAR
jgi:hypothetical protein